MTITDFLLARIAEDEADARTMQRWIDEMNANPPLAYEQEDPPDVAFADPNRVLAECEAKRQIVARASRSVVRTNSARPSPFGSLSLTEGRYYDGDRDVTDEYYAWHAVDGEPEDPQTLRTLAAVYADHPDFDPAWQPGS